MSDQTSATATVTQLPRQRSAPDASTELTDGELLARLLEGDQTAWRAVMDRYSRLVCSSVRRVLHDQMDVEEAAQRTWIALWSHADAVRDPARLAGWLSVTARREALALVRRRRREVLVEDVALFDIGTSPDVAIEVEQAERARFLRQAVEQLPARQRTLMRELLADRSSYDELSANLNIPRGSIGPMRARALRALRRRLQMLEPLAG